MRLFVSEYVSSGAWAESSLPDSLAQEGKAMLLAVLADFAAIDGCRVVTTWDRRLGRQSIQNVIENVEVHMVAGRREEHGLFRQLASDCEATFVIAPEFDRILAKRCRLVEAAGGRFLGASAAAVELCSDKLMLAEHLIANDVPTIPTRSFSAGECSGASRGPALRLPAVVKRRDGAGSQQMSLLADEKDVARFCECYSEAPSTPGLHEKNAPEENAPEMVMQPYLAGTPISVAAIVSPDIISPDINRVDVFPPGEQLLDTDGTFGYLGGRVPARDTVLSSLSSVSPIERLVRRTCETISGLSGYVGFDLIVPERAPRMPVLVEINPRLTTSYLGYRALTSDNLAERLLYPKRQWPPINWKPHRVEFDTSGRVRRVVNE